MRSCIGLTALLFVVGCGSSNDASNAAGKAPDGTNPPGDPPGSTTPPPGSTTPPTPGEVDQKPTSLTEILAGFDDQIAFWQGSQKRVFSIPQTLSSSLARITVASFVGTKATVATLPVKGTVATGHIEAMTYNPSGDVFGLIVRGPQPASAIVVVTMTLSATDATFATLAQSNPLTSDGFMFNALYPQGSGGFLALRGDSFLPLSINAGTATWGAPMTSDNFMRGNSGSVSFDQPRSRFIAFGKDVFVPPSTVNFAAVVGTSSEGAPGTWNDLSLASAPAAPPQNGGIYSKWAAWDATGQRLFTVIPQASTCFPGEPAPCEQQQLWVANLTTNSWSMLEENYNPPNMYKPFAIDDDNRRFFSLSDGIIGATSLNDVAPAQPIAITQDGDLGPSGTYSTSATVLADGRILQNDGGTFRVFDPAAASPRWERFGKATLAGNYEYRPTFTQDPTTSEILLFGGGSSNASPVAPLLQSLAKDGAALTAITISGDVPAGRTAHGAAFAGAALVIAGGTTGNGSDASTMLDDVWSLDRSAGAAATTTAWKKAATLPTPLSNVTLHAMSATEVWAIGFAKAAAGSDSSLILAPIVTIDLKSGTAKNIAVHGADAPTTLWSVAPLGTCFIGFESGTTVDGSQPNLWRCKKDGDGIIWEKTVLDADDYSLGGLTYLSGASNPDATRAFFIGHTMWATPAL